MPLQETCSSIDAGAATTTLCRTRDSLTHSSLRAITEPLFEVGIGSSPSPESMLVGGVAILSGNWFFHAKIRCTSSTILVTWGQVRTLLLDHRAVVFEEGEDPVLDRPRPQPPLIPGAREDRRFLRRRLPGRGMGSWNHGN